MIRAYHQVGTLSVAWTYRAELFDEIVGMGEIIPAVERVDQTEMWKECYQEEGSCLRDRFHDAKKTGKAALRALANFWLKKLPDSGSRHTLFNCVDLLAGDLGRVFLSIGRWYSGDKNGFVFDAEELLLDGARFRPFDFLGTFEEAIRHVVKRPLKTPKATRNAIVSMIDSVIEDRSDTGEAGILELEDCVAGVGDYQERPRCPESELVWDGPLPLSLAIEAWRVGELVWKRGDDERQP